MPHDTLNQLLNKCRIAPRASGAFCLIAYLLLAMPAHSGLVVVVRPDDWYGHKVHMLAVGINRYKTNFNLQYATQDATAAAAAFRQVGVDVTTLVDEAATREGIQKALAAEAQQLKSEDVFIFQFSGYGNNLGGGFNLKASDMDPNSKDSGIPAAILWAWLDRIQAKHLLVILDTDDASDFLGTVSARASSHPDDQADRDVSVIAPQGHPLEVLKLQHSQMTYALLQSIRKDSDLNGDGYLSAAELEAAMSVNAIRVQTAPKGGTVFDGLGFRVRSFSIGKDFAIGKFAPAASRGTATFREENPTPAQTLNGQYQALLIATNKYKEWNELRNPISDALAVEAELKTRFGFHTTLVPDPDVKTFRTAVANLKTMSFGPDDELFIFIAGHGTYDPGEKMGYLIAQDSQKDDLSHGTQVAENWIFKVLAGIPAKHVFVVIDACQSGAEFLTRSDTKPDLTYQPHQKLKVILGKKDRRTLEYMTSGGNEYVPDGEGPHSPFAVQLLRAFASSDSDPDGIVTLLDVMNMADKVERAPKPQYDRLPDGAPGADFWFVAKPELRGENTLPRDR
jgi:uncharacterized caspase-like protein